MTLEFLSSLAVMLSAYALIHSALKLGRLVRAEKDLKNLICNDDFFRSFTFRLKDVGRSPKAFFDSIDDRTARQIVDRAWEHLRQSARIQISEGLHRPAAEDQMRYIRRILTNCVRLTEYQRDFIRHGELTFAAGKILLMIDLARSNYQNFGRINIPDLQFGRSAQTRRGWNFDIKTHLSEEDVQINETVLVP